MIVLLKGHLTSGEQEYNHSRPQLALKGITPAERLCELRISTALGPLSYEELAEPMTVGVERIQRQRLTKLAGDEWMVVDLLLATEARLADVLARRVAAGEGEQRVWLAPLDGLRWLKRLRGSPQDLADLAALGEDAEAGTQSMSNRTMGWNIRKVAQLRALCRRLLHVPTPEERRLLAEFEAVRAGRAECCSQAAARAGFWACWAAGEHRSIVAVGQTLPREVLQTDRTLLTYYHHAVRLLGER